LIIDPYNELDPSRASGLKEHEHVNQTMAMLRKFARDYNVSTCNSNCHQPFADGGVTHDAVTQ
jgi:hypothetical protein